MTSIDWNGHVLQLSDIELSAHDAEAITAFASAIELATEQKIIELFEAEQEKCLQIALYANGPELLQSARELHAGLAAAIDYIKRSEGQE